MRQKMLFESNLKCTSGQAQINFSSYLFYETFLTELQAGFRSQTFSIFKPAFLAILLYFLSVCFILKPA
jgi:hypothetical protein